MASPSSARLLLWLSSLLMMSMTAVRAATHTVPWQYHTIQAAINASANSDTVLIADGTYTGPGNVDLDFGGKNITVTSRNGATKTIIDCRGTAISNHRGFYLHRGETKAVIRGLTIENGYEADHDTGAIPSPIYSKYGGGICIYGSRVAVQNCILTGNTVDNGDGGGIFCDSDNVITLTHCAFTGNKATTGGGAANLNDWPARNTTIILTHCNFTNNIASESGGGVSNQNRSGTITLSHCIFSGNKASTCGGVENYNFGKCCVISLTHCTLTGNSAADSGGGFYNDNEGTGKDRITLSHCTITRNKVSNGSGGGGYNFNTRSGTITLTHCTIARNKTSSEGGGIYNSNKSGVITLANDILKGDTGEIGGDHIIISHCDIEGGHTDTANTNADPLFKRKVTPAHLLSPRHAVVAMGVSDEATFRKLLPAPELDSEAPRHATVKSHTPSRVRHVKSLVSTSSVKAG